MSVYMNIALQIARLSKCVSFQVGAIIVKDGRPISAGYNGTPSGFINCDQMFPGYNKTIDREQHHAFSFLHEIHAEENAMIFAARHGVCIADADMFITVQPCMTCSKAIANSGIKAVYYLQPYDKVGVTTEEQKLFFNKCGVAFEQVYLDTE